MIRAANYCQKCLNCKPDFRQICTGNNIIFNVLIPNVQMLQTKYLNAVTTA
jgi:threonine dehydrogenase-like Zn-dependent dehydrogenase